jgi:hypothetical protein
MSFLRITLNGTPTVINLAHVMSASFDEAARQLYVKFADGESVMLEADEAARVWRILGIGTHADEVSAGDERAAEAAPADPPDVP